MCTKNLGYRGGYYCFPLCNVLSLLNVIFCWFENVIHTGQFCRSFIFFPLSNKFPFVQFFFCLLLSSIKHSPHNGDWCITKVSCTVRIPLPHLYILLYKTILFPTSGNFTQFSIGFIAYNTITEICILFSNHVQRIFGNSNNDVRKTYGR